ADFRAEQKIPAQIGVDETFPDRGEFSGRQKGRGRSARGQVKPDVGCGRDVTLFSARVSDRKTGHSLGRCLGKGNVCAQQQRDQKGAGSAPTDRGLSQTAARRQPTGLEIAQRFLGTATRCELGQLAVRFWGAASLLIYFKESHGWYAGFPARSACHRRRSN